MRQLTAAAYSLDANLLNGMTAAQFLQYSVGSVQTDSSSNATIALNKTGASGNIIELQGASGTDVFAINNAGQAVFRPQTDSQTALQVQKAGTTTTAFTVDTTNSRIGIGLNNPSYAVDAVGSVNASVSLKIAGIDVCTSGGCIPAPGNGNYIQNQSASPQSANINMQTTGNTIATATLKVIASQTADALDVKDASSGIIAGISSNGNIFTGPITTSSCATAVTSLPTYAQLFSQPCNSSSTAIVARAAASGTPTGDILDLQDATGTNNLVAVGATGATTVKSTSVTTFRLQDTTGTNILSVGTSSQQVTIGNVQGTPTSQLYISGYLPSSSTGFVQAAAKTPTGIKVIGNYAYVSTSGTGTDGLAIYDVTRATAPVQIGAVSAGGGSPQSVDVSGNYAFTIDSAGTLTAYNVVNPASPTVAGTLSIGGTTGIRHIVVQGEFAYIANFADSQMHIVNISNPASMTLSSTTATLKNKGIFVQGKYAYITDYNLGRLRIYDISNPASPSLVSTFTITGSSAPQGVMVQGRYAYIADDGNDKVFIIDVSNPATPVLKSTLALATGVNAWAIDVEGRYAYVEGNGDGTHFGPTYSVVDVSNPSSPTLAGTVSTPGDNGQDIFAQGRYLYTLASSSTATIAGIYIYDLGGAYLQQTEVGGVQTGRLTVDSDATIAGDANIQGGLQLAGNLYVNGDLGVNAVTSIAVPTSTTAAQITTEQGIGPGNPPTQLLTIDSNSSTAETLKVGGGNVSTDDSPVITDLDNKTSSADPTGIEGGMYFDVATHTFRCFFGGGANGRWRSCSSGVVFANTNAPTKSSGINQVGGGVSGTASEVAFGSNYTIPANDCTPGRIYTIYVRGTYNTTATAPTIILRIKMDSTVLAATTNTTVVAGSAVALGWELEGQVICDTAGASGTVDAQGYETFVNIGSGQGATSRAEQNPAGASSTVTIDTTTSHTLQVSAQWGTASATNYIIARQVIVEASGP
jgi:hypothetical protein